MIDGPYLESMRPKLVRFIARLGADREQAIDAAQQAVIKAWASRESCRAAERDQWLYRIARNVWCDEIRSLRRRCEIGLYASVHAAPTSDFEDVERRDEIRVAINAAGKDAELLLAGADSTYADVARAAGVNPSAVRFRVYAARRRLARRLGEETS